MNQILKKELIHLKSLSPSVRGDIATDISEIVNVEKRNDLTQGWTLTFDCKNPDLCIINNEPHNKAEIQIENTILAKEKDWDYVMESCSRIWRGLALHHTMLMNITEFKTEETKNISLGNLVLIFHNITGFIKEYSCFETEEEFKENIQKKNLVKHRVLF